jgi:uncharacterized damage-inducible protein DinB
MITTTQSLAAEFGHEVETTRRHLERLPDEKLEWRPHVKSFTAGGLASHIVECIGWAESIFTTDEFDFDPARYRPFVAASVADLLEGFDRKVARASKAIASANEAALLQPWRLKIMGRLKVERPRVEAVRDFTLSHVIHHRGQFSLYLRLLDVPVPGSYGPTADEQ